MPVPVEEAKRQSRWQRRAVILAGVLFPLLVAGGVVVAPQLITVLNEDSEQQVDLGDSEPAVLNFTRPFPGKTPLLPPRDYETGFAPELVDFEELFSDVEGSGSSIARQYAKLLGFPRSHGDVIVMDDVDRAIADVVFREPVLVGSTNPSPPSPGGFAGGPGGGGRGIRYDEPQISTDPQVVAIPEPGTGWLVALGLIAFGFRRRS
jgi:hypothetical protein